MLIEMTSATTEPTVTSDQPRLARWAAGLAWLTVGWNTIEAVVAIVSGRSANSSALIGFGLDSTIEVSSALIVLWQLGHHTPEAREQQALKLIAMSFFALAAWTSFSSVITLIGRNEPDASIIGIILALVSLIVMPLLAVAKRRVGRAMNSATMIADSAQTWLCTSLSAVLLGGLLANASLGWWWADPIAGLIIAAIAFREGSQAWRGQGCCAPTTSCR